MSQGLLKDRAFSQIQKEMKESIHVLESKHEEELRELERRHEEEMAAFTLEAKDSAAKSVLHARINMAKDAGDPAFKATWNVATWEVLAGLGYVVEKEVPEVAADKEEAMVEASVADDQEEAMVDASVAVRWAMRTICKTELTFKKIYDCNGDERGGGGKQFLVLGFKDP